MKCWKSCTKCNLCWCPQNFISAIHYFYIGLILNFQYVQTILRDCFQRNKKLYTQFLVKILIKLVDNTENIRNFVNGNYGHISCLILYK